MPRAARTFSLNIVKKSDKGSLFSAHSRYLCPKIFVFPYFLANYDEF